MKDKQVKETLRSVLHSFESSPEKLSGDLLRQGRESIEALAEWCERSQSFNTDQEHPIAPRKNPELLITLAGKMFPDIEYEKLPERHDPVKTKKMFETAKFEMAVLLGDLYQVEWYWENVGEEVALQYLHDLDGLGEPGG
jgi:hypothetical protein